MDTLFQYFNISKISAVLSYKKSLSLVNITQKKGPNGTVGAMISFENVYLKQPSAWAYCWPGAALFSLSGPRAAILYGWAQNHLHRATGTRRPTYS